MEPKIHERGYWKKNIAKQYAESGSFSGNVVAVDSPRYLRAKNVIGTVTPVSPLDLYVRLPTKPCDSEGNFKLELSNSESDEPLDPSVRSRRSNVVLHYNPDDVKPELGSDKDYKEQTVELDLSSQSPCTDTEFGNVSCGDMGNLKSKENYKECVLSRCVDMEVVNTEDHIVEELLTSCPHKVADVSSLDPLNCMDLSSNSGCENAQENYVSTAEDHRTEESARRTSDKIVHLPSGAINSYLEFPPDTESVELSSSIRDDMATAEEHTVEELPGNSNLKMVDSPAGASFDYIAVSSDSECESAKLSPSMSRKDLHVYRNEVKKVRTPGHRRRELLPLSGPNTRQMAIPSGSPDSVEESSCNQSELSQDSTGLPSCFNGLLTVGKYIPPGLNFTPKVGFSFIQAPSLVTPFLFKEPDKFPSTERNTKENKDFFSSFAGKFLIGLGLSRASEWCYRDNIRIVAQQLKKDGKSQSLKEKLKMHKKSYVKAKKANEPFSHPMKSCDVCDFVTESAIVLEHHLITHATFNPTEVLLHGQLEHNRIGRSESSKPLYACSNCTYESNSVQGLNSHQYWCQKKFNSSTNQAPMKNYEIPAFSPRPLLVAAVKIREKLAGYKQVCRGRPKELDYIRRTSNHASCNLNNESGGSTAMQRTFQTNSHLGPNTHINFCQMNVGSSANPPMPKHYSRIEIHTPQLVIGDAVKSRGMSATQNKVCGVRPKEISCVPGIFPVNSANLSKRSLNHNRASQNIVLPRTLQTNDVLQIHLAFPNLQLPPSITEQTASSGLQSHTGDSSTTMQNCQERSFCDNLHSSTICKINTTLTKPEIQRPVTPKLPKLQGPYATQSGETPSNTEHRQKRLVVCEICDGSIKNLEQLSAHMELIHKTKIHPELLISRPPLKCGNCDWLFYTDQGLERHLLCAHGVVTSHMEEMKKKGQDGGCCVICGGIYASKLVGHVNQIHKLTSERAELSYKCTVCSARFNLYSLFQNHVHLVHGKALKRPLERETSSPTKKIAKLSHSNVSFFSNC